MTRLSAESGQATVELVALLPLAVAAGLAGATILAAQSAAEHAGHAAHAGAIALLQDRDPRAAARDSLPAGHPRRDRRPRPPSHGHRPPARPAPRHALSATESADAGPEPAP